MNAKACSNPLPGIAEIGLAAAAVAIGWVMLRAGATKEIATTVVHEAIEVGKTIGRELGDLVINIPDLVNLLWKMKNEAEDTNMELEQMKQSVIPTWQNGVAQIQTDTYKRGFIWVNDLWALILTLRTYEEYRAAGRGNWWDPGVMSMAQALVNTAKDGTLRAMYQADDWMRDVYKKSMASGKISKANADYLAKKIDFYSAKVGRVTEYTLPFSAKGYEGALVLARFIKDGSITIEG